MGINNVEPNNNGYVVVTENQVLGPFISLTDALDVGDYLNAEWSVKAINKAPGCLIVKDCDRPECGHCRDMQRDARKALRGFHERFRDRLAEDEEFAQAYEKFKAEL